MSTRIPLIATLLMVLALFIALPLSVRAQSWTLVEVASLWPEDRPAAHETDRAAAPPALSFTTAVLENEFAVSRRSRVLFARRDGRTVLDMGYWPTALELDPVSPYGFGWDGRLGVAGSPSGMMLELSDGDSGVTSYFGAGYRDFGASPGSLPGDERDMVGFYAVAGLRFVLDSQVDFFADYRFSTAMDLQLGWREVDGGLAEGTLDPRASAVMGGFRINF
ncbi:MAG: hypothetical protein RLO50_12685 [Azospirillaceae bacterium]